MNISEFLQEDNGKRSVTRLVLLLWAIGMLAVWVVGSFHHIYFGLGEGLLELPASTITLLGLLIAGKVVQKHEEQPAVTVSDTPKTVREKGRTDATVQPTPATG
jgi:hypothetical protein